MHAARPTRPDGTTPRRAVPGARLVAALVAFGCLAVLAVAAWLVPAAAGHGTHTSIGLPPCSWAVWFGKPCLTCGMTTAFAHAGEGRWDAALVVQPAGAALALATATAFWFAAHAALTGSRIGPMIAPLLRPRAVTLGVGALLAAWVYKILTWNGF